MSTKGQGHSLTLDQVTQIEVFSNLFSSITARRIETKFHVEPPWGKETKVYTNGPGHIIKMAAMTIYDKNL